MKIKFTKLIFGLFVLSSVILAGCGRMPFSNTSDLRSEPAMMDSVSYESSYYDGKVMGMGGGGMMTDSFVMKTAYMVLHVDQVQKKVEEISASVEEWKGSVLYSNVNRGDSSYSANMQIRVESEFFEQAISALKEMSLYVTSESINANDATEAVADLQARLTNLQAEEQAYLDLMNRAGSVTEILEVTRALSEVRNQIEWLENDLEYYSTRISYSTIDLYLTEDGKASLVSETWRPSGTFSEAISNFVVALQSLADLLIYLVIFGGPIAIIAFVIWKVRKRTRKSKK